jgi:mRNA-degrading endonuclease toxin of MazEF toxin-antitoxin module
VVARGEVCCLELAEEGPRPVCVLIRDEATPKLRNVVVALITRTIRGIETEVQLDASDGMPPRFAERLRLRAAATDLARQSL